MKPFIGAVAVICLLTGASFAATKPIVKHVISASWCEPCKDLATHLRGRGVKVTICRGPSQSVEHYPCAVYSDGAKDYGQRIYGRTCRLPKAIKFIETE